MITSRTAHKRGLGKRPAVLDPRVPHLANVARRLVTPPDNINWYAAVADWLMLGNDQVGDCVEAAVLHAIMQLSTYAGVPLVPTEQDAIAFYSAAAGYVPGDASTDQGSIVMGPQGVMQYWHKNGVTVAGTNNKVEVFLQVASQNPLLWRQGIWTFGGMMLGLRMPAEIVDADEVPYVWDVKAGAVLAGGHEVWCNGCLYEAGERLYDIVSWGSRYRITESMMRLYMDEAVVLYDPASMNKDGVDGRGLSHAALLAAMDSYRSQLA